MNDQPRSPRRSRELSKFRASYYLGLTIEADLKSNPQSWLLMAIKWTSRSKAKNLFTRPAVLGQQHWLVCPEKSSMFCGTERDGKRFEMNIPPN